MVLYHEHNPDDEAIGSCAASDMRLRPDAVIVAGTTLKVPGVRRIAREMCNIVRDRRDGVAIWINNDPEPVGKDLEEAWDLVVKGPCDEVARHANMRRWDDPMDFKEVTEMEVNKIKERQRAEVVIGTPKKPGVLRTAGQLTPGQSPRILPQMLKQDPGTPSKKGTKRKSEAQMDLFGKMAGKAPAKKSQAKPKKSTSSKARAKKDVKEVSAGINTVFKATKGAKPSEKASQKKDLGPTKPDTKTQARVVPKGLINDVIHVEKRSTPKTPQKEGKGAKVTKFRKGGPVMAPLSDADLRNNQSPTRPAIEGFTPTKPRTPSEQIREESLYTRPSSPADDSRPSTASSQRHEIERPNSIPHGMTNILC